MPIIVDESEPDEPMVCLNKRQLIMFLTIIKQRGKLKEKKKTSGHVKFTA